MYGPKADPGLTQDIAYIYERMYSANQRLTLLIILGLTLKASGNKNLQFAKLRS